MMRLLLGIGLMVSLVWIGWDIDPTPRGLAESTLNNFGRNASQPDVKLLIRRLRKGRLGAGGLALVAQLDERSMSSEPELKEKLELVSSPGLEVQTDYAFNLDAPTYGGPKGTWIHNPGDFEFALKWTSHYQELFGGTAGHIRVNVHETFIVYRVRPPSAVKKFLCSYDLDREIVKDKEAEFKRLNETVVAAARGQILKEIREFINTRTSRKTR